MYWQAKQNKFHAKKTEWGGTVFDSKKEASRAAELDMLHKGKAILGWRGQEKLSFDICVKCKRLCAVRCPRHPRERVSHLTNYFLDFVIEENDGTETWEEIKSKITMTDTWRLKWKLTEALYGDNPKIKLVVLL